MFNLSIYFVNSFELFNKHVFPVKIYFKVKLHTKKLKDFVCINITSNTFIYNLYDCTQYISVRNILRRDLISFGY